VKLVIKILRRLRKANLEINWKKYQFDRKKLTHLGRQVTKEDIDTDTEKISAILGITLPRKLNELSRLNRMVLWDRRFVPSFFSFYKNKRNWNGLLGNKKPMRKSTNV
jgi:isocitrate/isopropylmalate dehydrogenase